MRFNARKEIMNGKSKVLSNLKKVVTLLVMSPLFLTSCTGQAKKYFLTDGEMIIGLTEVGKTIKDLTLPEKANGNSITQIAPGAFADSQSLESIRLPKEITFLAGSLLNLNELILTINNTVENVVFEGGGNTHSNIQIQITTISTKGLNLTFDDFNLISAPQKSPITSSAVGTVQINSIGSLNDIKALSGKEGISLNNAYLKLSGNAPLKISGGNGLTDSNGAFGIKAKSLTLLNNADVEVIGGNGGNGSNGQPGQQGSNGGQGNAGSQGASAISTPSINSQEGSLKATSGNGGNGGNGGQGGQGLTGQEGVIDLSGHPWSNGTAGGLGGRGGNGGNAGLSSDPIICEAIVGEDSITQRRGLAGNGGDGGRGGRGGTGGSGGHTSTTFIDTPYGLDGGNGGNGGQGGNGGNGLVPGLAGLGGEAGQGGQGKTKPFGLFQQFTAVGKNGSPGLMGEPGLPGNTIS